jgi:glycosyltransferase involved in cell wall biosynthesis
MSAQVSAVLITLNEEADIARALDSVSWCDEILVVDSGSADRTVEICAAKGCKVLHRTFTGYGEQKAYATSQAAHDWVLVVDADEEVTPALRDEIRARLESPGEYRGFRIPITTILWDQVVRTQGRHTADKLRLFDRRYGNFQNQLVHESVALNGATALLRERMYNYSYANIADYFDKFNRYTSAAAQQLFARGKKCTIVGSLLRLPLTFFQFYLGKGYFRDGAIGATWSLFSALYPTVKYLKLWELNFSASQPPARAQLTSVQFPAAQQIPASTVTAHSAVSTVPVNAKSADGAATRARPVPAFILASAACVVSLALLWRPLFGQEPPGDYAACLLFSVLVTARLWGHRAALVATAISILALDYFTIPPPDAFTVPRSQDIYRLGLFLALALLTISVVHRVRRPIQ